MKKILIGEDDDFLAMAYKVKLVKADFEVQIARDGNEIISMLSEFNPDLIILDIIMPKKDGFEALKEIKANSKWKNIPVIIASNLGQKEEIDKGMALGALDYISKSSLSLKDLIEKIHTILK
jgi:DNA-binding response OmpR family regulator